ncbi:hypothetical protein HPK19_17220 [Arthrobacter citreus]|nr:hypothetical protein HPK19_17220 [Arthrobacter citreus]
MYHINYSFHWRTLQKIGILLTVISILGSLFLSCVYFMAITSTKPSLFIASNSSYYDHDNKIISKTQLLQNRKTLKIADVPPIAINSVLVSEDRNFFHHHGFDLKRLGSAILVNLTKGQYAQGASTITQQLAKNLYLSQEKTLSRKIKEAYLTMKLESSYKKSKILEAYLNTIYFGHGIYGLETAANTFLGKETKQLTVGESTFLLSIPANPSIYDPYIHFSSVKRRQQRILSALEKNKLINSNTVKNAMNESIKLKPIIHTSNSSFTSYFQQSVQKEITESIGQSVNNNGSKIYTTFNPTIQNQIDQAFDQYIKPFPNLQASVIVLDSQTGNVLGMTGGREKGQFLFNRAVASKRQVGSTIKPILYYSALENGYTPSTMLQSKPTTFHFEDGDTYSPKNSGHLYAHDQISLAKAIAVSDNIFAVKTQQAIGADEFIKAQKLFYLTAPKNKLPSMALGTQDASLLDMTRAYALIANNGKDVTPHFVSEIKTQSGKSIFKRKVDHKQRLEKDQTVILKQLMNGMFNTNFSSYLPVTGTSIIPELSKDYYGKTGTTKTDSWMVGFHSNLVVGVWVGYDHSTNLSAEETSLAKKVWASVITNLSDKKVDSKIPKDIVKVAIDEKTGLLYKEGCGEKVSLYFRKGTQPTKPCINKKKTKKHKKEKQDNTPWYSQYLP